MPQESRNNIFHSLVQSLKMSVLEEVIYSHTYTLRIVKVCYKSTTRKSQFL